MTALLSQAKNDYLLQVGIDYLQQESIEWISEIDFAETELSFLSNLLNRAFLFSKDDQKLKELNFLEEKVVLLKNNSLKQIKEKLILHEEHLGNLEENIKSFNEQSIREEHINNKSVINIFLDSLKSIKKEIFGIIEIQLKKNKKIINDFEQGGMSL